ncbi:substrate-binding domain-containing protein, partial [Limnobacter sp.]|uniref:substrate-binding domain-containing protein n=1 Tax=Limnobacter sp. TaxID=2003368 RepID=UPI00311F48F5
MKKFIAIVASALIATAAFARDKITIVGSSTVYPFTTIVAEKLGNQGFPTPIVESTGTGGGAKLFCAGVGVRHPDFTNASRALKKSEREMCASNGVKDIIEIIVGNDGIAFANSVKGPKLNLTVQDLWKAMAEKGPKPKFWNEVREDLPEQEIIIMAPPPTSGTRDAWVELVMHHGCPKEIKKADKKSCELFR